MATGGVPIELAQAYVSVALSTKGLGKDIVRNLNRSSAGVGSAGETAGRSFGKGFSRGEKKAAEKSAVEAQIKAVKIAIAREAAAVKKARETEEAATRKLRIEEQKLQEARDSKRSKQSTIFAAEDRRVKALQAQAKATADLTGAEKKHQTELDNLIDAEKRGIKTNKSFGQSFKDIFKGKNPFSQANKGLDGVGRKSATLYGSGFRRGLAAFSYSNVFGSTFKNITRGIALSGTTAGVAFGAGLVLGLKKSVTAAGDFEATINFAVGVLGASGKAAEAAKKAFTDLSITLSEGTVFSAQQAADAIQALTKGGMTRAQIQAGGLKGAMDLAAAGGIELGDSAEFVIKGLSAFQIKAKDVAVVVNALAGAANASVADIADIGLALAQVGPGARAAGFSIQETTAAIAAFSNAGLKGSDAGTSLKTFITNLVPSSKKAADLMADLGLLTKKNGKLSLEQAKKLDKAQAIQVAKLNAVKIAELRLQAVRKNKNANPATIAAAEERLRIAREKLAWANEDVAKASKNLGSAFFDANGKVKPMTEIAELLRKKLGGLSKEQQILATRTLFGSDAARAAQILTREGAKGLAKYIKQTSNLTAAQKLAQARTEGWNGAKTKLTNGFKTLQIQIGTFLLPQLTRFANYVTKHILPVVKEWVKRIGPQLQPALDKAGRKLIEFGKSAQKFFGWLKENWHTIVDVAGALIAVGLAIAPIIAAIRTWIFVQGLLNIVMSLNPIGLIIIGIIALVAGIILAYKKSETFREVVQFLWMQIKIAAAAIVVAFKAVVAWFKGPFMAFVHAFIARVKSDWGLIKYIFTHPLEAAGRIIIGILGKTGILRAFVKAKEWVLGTFKAAWAGLKYVFTHPLEVAGLAIITILGKTGILKTFLNAKNWVINTFGPAWAKIKNIVLHPIQAARDAISAILSDKKPGLRWQLGVFVDAAKRIWDKLKDAFKEPIRFVVNTVINDGLRKAFNWVTDKLKIDMNIPEFKLPKGFDMGGWTGPGSRMKPAGVVHADEFVIKKSSRKKIESDHPGLLDHLNRRGRMPGYAVGGLVGGQGRFTPQFAGRLIAAQKKLDMQFQIFQRGFRPTTSYSGTSHRGDAVDLGPSQARIVAALRSFGIAAWRRDERHGGFSLHHIHGVPLPGAGKAGGSGIWQAQDYLRGGDGLGGRDYEARPGHPGSFAGGSGFFASIGEAIKSFKDRFAGTLGKINSTINGSPFGAIVGGAAKVLSQAVVAKVKDIANPFADAGGYASGTNSAARGWSWVGENGPELRWMKGGEKILDNRTSMAMAGGDAGLTINGGNFGYSPEAIFREQERQKRKARIKNNLNIP